MDWDAGRVAWDHSSAAAYAAAAGEAAALLGAARERAREVAGIDLSGLGVLGREFAAAWTAAWTVHGGHLRTAAAVTDAYGRAVSGWGRALEDSDAESADRIAGAGEDRG